jgi:hypothetical protein
MRLAELYHEEHIYSGLVRSRYLSGQMFISERRFFELNELPYHWIRSQTPLCTNLKALIDVLKLEPEESYKLRLHHSPLAPWHLSYENGQDPMHVELSGLRNNIEENPFNIDRRWKFCPDCVVENRAEHGVSYWHSKHQLLGARTCYIHHAALHSHEDLRYLNFTLPHHWLDKSEPLVIEEEWQKQWQPFIFKISAAIESSPSIVHQLKKEAYKHLPISIPIKQSHKAAFNSLFLQMREELGEECLCGLFSAYARKINRAPNILWVTLSPFSNNNGLRHPLYWLSILFWLRDKLPSLRGL